jgi:hypothetical protein
MYTTYNQNQCLKYTCTCSITFLLSVLNELQLSDVEDVKHASRGALWEINQHIEGSNLNTNSGKNYKKQLMYLFMCQHLFFSILFFFKYSVLFFVYVFFFFNVVDHNNMYSCFLVVEDYDILSCIDGYF